MRSARLNACIGRVVAINDSLHSAIWGLSMHSVKNYMSTVLFDTVDAAAFAGRMQEETCPCWLVQSEESLLGNCPAGSGSTVTSIDRKERWLGALRRMSG